jgi:NAD-dependent dihydropyrimidine dehydrogenase PreA subunit
MIKMEVDKKCLRYEGKDCKICVSNCPVNVLGVRGNKIVPLKRHAKECILCFVCKGACPVNLDVINIWEEN